MTDRTCRYCGTPIDGGSLDFCSIQHYAWWKFGTPPLLAKKHNWNDEQRDTADTLR